MSPTGTCSLLAGFSRVGLSTLGAPSPAPKESPIIATVKGLGIRNVRAGSRDTRPFADRTSQR